ncbi:type VI secretion system tip protein VgrG [Campylobacter lari]|uniref:type VI secretion system Vgr family protein n=9 Tax=Campylobacter lari TaxID=201 RepID=UPI001285531B|nr:type VI secretion system tip protein TssI/VgrG [Campylobacter lari]HDX3798412.1 type VI secretion system tip protein VgrG [Campylobacter jejuni]EAJ5686733.1 type VI secretion system tip protein VgrG [Campylobacter lari]EAL2460579.1 type VI secretion system tip protein VgrG [Campylobacter lari]ECP5284162.1 type VI secretion system tip protein VgrG [Campylobacter lari]MCV3528337.1 type VI secretion system tip protein VgrG [Campylobacter lari]
MNTHNSYLNLKINKLDFKITKAIIKESLDQIFLCECEGFYENINNDIFSDDNIEFNPNMLIDKEASLIIKNPYENKKIDFSTNIDMIYKGIISYVEYLGINQGSASNIVKENFKQLNHKHFFKFNLHSPLIRLDFNKANRIYTHTNIIEVIKQTLAYYNTKLNKNIDFSNIHHIYETKELISQYNESDLEFITRLAHNHGIYFYEDKDNIYFYDFYTHKGKIKDIVFNPNINNHLNETCIYALNKEKQIQTNAFTHSSNNSKQPLSLYSLSTKAQNTNVHYNEHYYESEYSFTQNINLKQSPTLKEKRNTMLNNILKAKSNIYHLSLNESIKINIQKETTKEYTIIAKEQILIDDAILANTINTNDNLNIKDLNLSKSYTNNLTLIPSFLTFTPSFKSKPKPPINTMGIVIGEDFNIENQRNTIYTDEYGRVKVRINLYANQEELDNKTNMYHHSPFLRVASSVASNHSGFYHTPRIGDEVIISFLDDDIDKPFISGSLYNGVNDPLVSLPHHDHKTSISSKTIGIYEQGYNELTLSNLKDKEQIYLKAERDYDELVQHNFTQRILNDKDSIVDGIYNERIKKVHAQTIDLAKNVNVGAEYLINVGLSKDTIVGLSNTLNVGVDNKLRVAKNSSEYIGENKDTEICANKNTIIHKDETRNVKGNKKEIIEGYYNINTSNKIQVLSEKEIDYKSKDNILFTSNESIGFESDKNTSMVANNITTYAKTTHYLKADSEATIQVGETLVNAKPDCVIIKVGGVEVVIDSKGLVVKGGEIKAE